MASTETKRPTYSSLSARSFLTGLATVTCGAGGGALCASGWLGPQPASPTSKSNTAGNRKVLRDMDLVMRFSVWLSRLSRRGGDMPAVIEMQNFDGTHLIFD